MCASVKFPFSTILPLVLNWIDKLMMSPLPKRLDILVLARAQEVLQHPDGFDDVLRPLGVEEARAVASTETAPGRAPGAMIMGSTQIPLRIGGFGSTERAACSSRALPPTVSHACVQCLELSLYAMGLPTAILGAAMLTVAARNPRKCHRRAGGVWRIA